MNKRSINQISLGISMALIAGTLLAASIAIPAAYADKNCVNCKNRIGGNQDNSQTTTNNNDNSQTTNNIDNSVSSADNRITQTCGALSQGSSGCTVGK
jgi:hypothetical protein